MTDEVKDKVLAFIQSKNEIPGASEAEKLACLYLEDGIIDSMGLVQMVLEFEDFFGICFSPSEMQSEDFRTIGGVIQVINRLREAKPNA